MTGECIIFGAVKSFGISVMELIFHYFSCLPSEIICKSSAFLSISHSI